MEIPQEGKYVSKLNGQLVIYEASTGSLCGAVPCVMVESGFTFKHTLVLVKADGAIQTKTIDTLKKGNRPAVPSYGEGCGCGRMAG